NTQSLKLGTQACALTGLGHSSLLKLGLAAVAFSFTNGGHQLSAPQQKTDVRPGYSRPPDHPVALRVTRSLSVGPGGAFERRGSGQPDLDAIGRLAIAREKAPSDEVVDDRAGDREHLFALLRGLCHASLLA